MAVILEVLDARAGTVRTRIRLDALPFTLGRGYDNDLILDDPYVDAHHARIALDDEGVPVVEDLGSVNGLVAPEAERQFSRMPVRAGVEVRLGRTILRFRDPAEPVPPALPCAAESAPARGQWFTTSRGRAAVSAAAVIAIGVTTWLGSYERSSASNVVGAIFAFLGFASIWAGIWAAAGRIVVHRFHFLGHFAVFSAATLVVVAHFSSYDWARFLFPDNAVSDFVFMFAGLALIAALVAGHLSLASALPRRRRWRAGLVVSGVFLVLGGVTALADGDSFSDIPEFAGVLKPFAVRWVPAVTVEEFGRVAAELKDEVDAMAAKE